MRALLTVLGSGTSMGVPTLGCACRVCTSPDPRDRRTRPSILLQYGGCNVLVDSGPDFRHQAIREGVTHVDAVLYTHAHADHILGLDDLRPLSFKRREPIPLYADEATAATLERIFDYTFTPTPAYPNSARVVLHRLHAGGAERFPLHGACIQQVPVLHGHEQITGYRFGSAAYLTDMSDVPEPSLALLRDLDVLILDALRHKPHPSHSHLDKSVALVERIRPRRAFFTHMSHGLHHEDTNRALPEHMRLAYDGMKVEFEI